MSFRVKDKPAQRGASLFKPGWIRDKPSIDGGWQGFCCFIFSGAPGLISILIKISIFFKANKQRGTSFLALASS